MNVNINKGTKDQTGANTLSNDMASSTMEKNAFSFPIKIKLYKSLVLSALQMRELDADGKI